jgi:hypothetical protein
MAELEYRGYRHVIEETFPRRLLEEQVERADECVRFAIAHGVVGELHWLVPARGGSQGATEWTLKLEGVRAETIAGPVGLVHLPPELEGRRVRVALSGQSLGGDGTSVKLVDGNPWRISEFSLV